ncbi:hypothetical protein M9Y10_014478 [Tritrichomonas musculus]|uniref:Leucine-rich repeat domain-containing protein n=1 Tax=Tritrichomonas musculus TaxID=1915356 RepID=A0ABR2L2V1_9EUKA
MDEVYIPSKVSKIYENAFAGCRYLTKVEIPKNSNLQTIGEHAFYRTKINVIFIPPKVSEISNFTFYLCSNFQKIEISTNSNLQVIEPLAFADSKVLKIL